MKLFKQLLVAPAALGLLAPMAANANELNLDGVNQYASQEQVTSISQFSDVRPTDWAYQALSNLIERYGCVAGYPNGTYKGGQAMTRYEAAALLNACLDRITEVTDELKRLMKEFEKELAVLRGRVDGLEAKVGELEANQFSTTTKLKGKATFVLGANSFNGDATFLRNQYRSELGATTFNYDVQLDFDTSFTGKDLLRTRLRAGNFRDTTYLGGNEFAPNPLSALEIAFQESEASDNIVAINRLFYQFPVGSDFTVTIGGRVRQDDMLAMWPSVYPADTVLDFFTYAGAPAAYSLNLGSGAGIWWQKNGWSVSLNYVAANGNEGNPNIGGIGTDGSAQTGTAQIGYAAENWGLAVAYTYANGIGFASGTPFAVGVSEFGGFDSSNSIGISGYWQPSQAGWVPSISAGWGLTGYNSEDDAFGFDGLQSQSWYVGLQWEDVFIKGNAAGMAVGQGTFITSFGNDSDIKDALGDTPNDGNYVWEWWYKFQVTDNISVTPAIYYLSAPLGQLQKVNGDTFNQFGGLVKTTFKF
ncbi:iron uptake porin [Synechococcus sp. CCY9201]|uniref:iron uptake porin n=1 Tax=unclassified Synechococcus TaxID=2626047 RepID=UPI0018CEBC87|nr:MULTISPECIES: iron uptake porin [unclassified Synechococcus]MEA5475719.1 iron uptake porin [Synechococcus sp. CCY9201]QPN60331.1 carbohydrate porin [Synechococcus sp. CBW1002]QPN67953.1 carbohydrate porin [Synechococcus sp. CBW1006]CAK6689743.1 putative protein [Synechococcus sp. CBW1107]